MARVVQKGSTKGGVTTITKRGSGESERDFRDRSRDKNKSKPRESKPINLSKPQPTQQPQDEPIRTAEPAKTESFDRLKEVGIKKWVSENTKKHPIMAATTVALAITAAATAAMALAGVSFAGGAATGTTGKAVITQTAFKHELVSTATGGTRFVGRGAITTQRAFTGTVTKNTALVDKMVSIGFKTNAATVASSTNMLTKIAGGVVGATLLVGAIGTYPFAKFELAESMDKLGIAMFVAMEAKDWDTVSELAQIQKEMSDPSMTDKILQLIPYANVYAAAAKNAEAAILSAEIFDYLAQKELDRQEKGESEADVWAAIQADQDAREEKRRKDAAEYYAEIEENNAKAKADARAEDEKYWAKILSDRKAQEEADRIANDKYWAAVRIANDQARAASQRSVLNFGLL